jgi:hypothetical protein
MKNKIENIDDDSSKDKIITEYVETFEGDGVSIIPLDEKEENIDGEVLING